MLAEWDGKDTGFMDWYRNTVISAIFMSAVTGRCSPMPRLRTSSPASIKLLFIYLTPFSSSKEMAL